jgi:hypothetical protein
MAAFVAMWLFDAWAKLRSVKDQGLISGRPGTRFYPDFLMEDSMLNRTCAVTKDFPLRNQKRGLLQRNLLPPWRAQFRSQRHDR